MVPNYYYPMGYTPQYPQENFQRTILDRVQGEASANIYPVQAGQEVILFDIDSPFVYRKERGLDNKLTETRYRLVEDEPTKEPTFDFANIESKISEIIDKKMSEYVGINTQRVGNVSENKKGDKS